MTDAWINKAKTDAVVDIGQLTKTDRQALDRLVKSGSLKKYRGHWNTRSDAYGMGPLKTIWTAA